MKKSYGIPYKGSKNRIAEDIIEFLPSGITLVDLFGGGGAITDCASKSGKWETVIYNELDKLPHDCFLKALKGEFDDENRWISREDFDRLKDTDCYVACCFSFGNDFKTYKYSKEKEPLKKKCHEAIMNNPDYIKAREEMKFGECQQIRQPYVYDIFKTNKERIPHILNLERLQALKRMQEARLPIQEKYLGMMNTKRTRNPLQHILCLEHLLSIKSESTDNILFYNNDYRNVSIPEGSIIYCDIPYRNTNKYKKSIAFDYDAFYNWCVDMKNNGYVDVYVSEYDIPDDRFVEVWRKEKRSTFNDKNNIKTIEKIYKVK